MANFKAEKEKMTEIYKTCCRCKSEKTPDDFHRDKSRKDGRYPVCKECCRLENRGKKKERIEYYKKYNQTPEKNERRKVVQGEYKKSDYYLDNRKDWHKIATAKQRKKFPEKFKARSILNEAIKSGKINRGKCFVCGSKENIEGHHEDYSKPLDVDWMCVKHHKELHLKTS